MRLQLLLVEELGGVATNRWVKPPRLAEEEAALWRHRLVPFEKVFERGQLRAERVRVPPPAHFYLSIVQ
jgi:hypothetical protein